MTADLGLSATLVHQISRGLGLLGADPAEFLRRVGADDATRGYVPGAEVLPVLDALALELKRPNLGLALAVALRYGELGFVGLAVATSPSLGEALRRMCRFFGLLSTRADLLLEEGEGTVRLVQRMRPRAPSSRHLTDMMFGRFVLSMHDLVDGPVTLRGMKLAYDAPTDTREHREVFGDIVSFGAREDTLEMDPALLSRPLRTSDPTVAAILAQYVSVQMQARLVPQDAFLDEVRAAIARRLATRTHGLAATAKELRVPSRTLQRRLEERSLSYRTLLDSVRRELATDWMKEGKASHAEIAYALGFSDPTAFYHALRRWSRKA